MDDPTQGFTKVRTCTASHYALLSPGIINWSKTNLEFEISLSKSQKNQAVTWFYSYRLAGNFRGRIIIFANFRLFAKILSANGCPRMSFFVDKDRAIALILENIIREMLYLAHSRPRETMKGM